MGAGLCRAPEPRTAAVAGPGAAASVLLGSVSAHTSVCALFALEPPDTARSAIAFQVPPRAGFARWRRVSRAARSRARPQPAAPSLLPSLPLPSPPFPSPLPQSVLSFTCAHSAQVRTRVVTAAIPCVDAAATTLAAAVRPRAMALALCKQWALHRLDGAPADAIVDAIDMHARVLGDAHGVGARGGRRLPSGGVDALCRLLYAARRSPALSALLQHDDDGACAALALAAAPPRLCVKMVRPRLLAVRARESERDGIWELEYEALAAAADLCLRRERVIVIDHGCDICIW